jgi:transposase InsO family protein
VGVQEAASGSNCKGDLTIAALQIAIEFRQRKAGLIHRSDRGSHYTGDQYRVLLAEHGMKCSMSRTAKCLDNAVAESFFSTLKERVHTVRAIQGPR